VYHGPLGHDSQELIKYFEENGARRCPPHANPAEYMLEIIGAGDPNYKGKDWADVWARSKHHQARSDEIADMIEKRAHVAHSKNVKDDREYAMPLSKQTAAVVQRSFVSYWRTPNYIVGKFILHVMTGLFNCFTFYHLGYAKIDFQSRIFSVFMTLTISPPLMQQLQPVFLRSRNIFRLRENNAKIYSWFAWTTGAILAEIPYSLIAGGVYFCCWWWGIFGYRVSSFTSGFTFLCLCLFELYYVGLGQMIASFAPNELFASLLIPFFFFFVVSFCGVIVPPPQLPTFWRSWMYWLTPFHYLLEALLGVSGNPILVPGSCHGTEGAQRKDHAKSLARQTSTNSPSCARPANSPVSTRRPGKRARATRTSTSAKRAGTSKSARTASANSARTPTVTSSVGASASTTSISGGTLVFLPPLSRSTSPSYTSPPFYGSGSRILSMR